MSPFSPVLSSESLCSASFFPEPCLPSSCPIYFSTCKVSIKNSRSYSSFRFFKIKTHMINLCLVNTTHFFFFLIYFLAVLGLRFCARAYSSCSKRGPLFIAVCGPVTIAASLVAEHRLQTRRLSSCGSRA